jgi:hypothetical protein
MKGGDDRPVCDDSQVARRGDHVTAIVATITCVTTITYVNKAIAHAPTAG